MRRLLWFGLCLWPAIALTQTPPIELLETQRAWDALDDLEISWFPPSQPVDGYRVYRSTDLRCATEQLVYEGTQASYTDAGAFLAPELALYRVSAFVGTEESALTEPVYKIPVEIPVPTNFGTWIAFPYHRDGGLERKDDVCWFFEQDGVDIWGVMNAGWSGCPLAACCPCLMVIPIEPGYAGAVMDPLVPGQTFVWGHGHPEWLLELDTNYQCVPPYWPRFSLPYDHAYSDLWQIAREIPEAVDIGVWDPELEEWVGLSRPSSGSPWSGTNVELGDSRTSPLSIGVDVDTNWVPRRLCGVDCPPQPQRVLPVRLAKASAGQDVALYWSPELLADGGYVVYRVTDKESISLVLSEPELTSTPETEPAFPFLDSDAFGAAEPFYYQVVARCADGAIGAL